MRAWIHSLLALSLVACAQGPAPTEAELGQDGAGSGDLPPAPQLEAPEGSKPPPQPSAPPAPGPAPVPPRNAEPGCPGIDEHGSCRGDRAIWCEAGRVRSLDCGAIGLTCDWVDQETGYYCADASQADPAPAPPPGQGAPAPEGEGAPPPPGEAPPPVPPEEEEPADPVPPEEEEEEDGPAAPPPPVPEEEESPDPVPPPGAPAPPEDEGAPPPADAPEGAPAPEEDPCEGIDYLGACEEDVAVWCDVDRLRRADCGANGQVCGWINDRTGFYCEDPEEDTDPEVEPPVDEGEGAPPPPDDEGEGAPPPEGEGEGAPPPDGEDDGEENPAPPIGEGDGCGEVSWQGHCEGDVVVYCDGAGVVRHDCGPEATCGWVSDDIGNFCVAR